MCISSECRLVKTDFDSTRIMAQAVANNYRSGPHVIAYLVSIAVCICDSPKAADKAACGFWLQRLVCGKCLVRSLAFACSSLLPTFYHHHRLRCLALWRLGLARPPCSEAHLRIQLVKRFLCSCPVWTANRHAAKGVEPPTTA